MKIKIIFLAFLIACFQFQGKAALMSGGYSGPIGEAGSVVPISFNYTIVTPNPDLILYFPLTGIPATSTAGTSVFIDGVSVPFMIFNPGTNGIYIKLINPNLAITGAKVMINSYLLLPPFAGQFSLGPIQTAYNSGFVIDQTGGFSGPPLVVTPRRVTFLATTAITNSSFTLNWNSSLGADNYKLDVSTSPSFSTFVTGYANLSLGTVLTYNVTGLSPNTTYYIRVASFFLGTGTPAPASSISVTTLNSSITPATVSLSNLTATYDGSPHAATATTTPAGLAVEITYNGSSTVPKNAGTYAVVATVSDPSYQGSAMGSLVISKATANPVFGNLNLTYDGLAHAATATTTPTGLTVGITYNGSSVAPTNVGTYAVTATVSDANYQGSTTSSLTIYKTKSMVFLNNLTATYDGLPHAATATTTPTGLLVDITYDGSSTVPKNAGTYTVSASVNDVNYLGFVDGILVISKATANPVLSNLTATYNGSPRPATATTSPAGLAVGVTYNGSATVPTNAGTYAVVATVNEANYQGTATGSLVISSKITANPVLSNLTATYNGSPRPATATTSPAGLAVGITYNGSATVPVNAGTYIVVATVNEANYQGSATGSLVIAKATANPVLSNLTVTYNGSSRAATAATNPAGLAVGITYNGSATVPTNAGTYAVVATVNEVNYQGSATGSLVIGKATANPVLSNLTVTYNGSPRAATVTTNPAGLAVGITYNGSSTIPTNAGTYPVIATVNDANYQGSATGSLVIGKATANPVLSNLTVTYNGSPRAATVTTNPAGLAVGITYNGSSTIPTNAGTYPVAATVNDANYQGSATGSLVIAKATANPVLSNLTVTYNGSPRVATVTTNPAGLAVGITYNGSSTIPTNAGTYPVIATVNDANYQGSATGSLVIGKATANPVLSNLTVTYNGSPRAATVTTNPAGLAVGITYNGSSTIPTNAGTYPVAATVNDANYQGSSTGSLVIGKATANPVLSNLTATYDGFAHSVIATTAPTGLKVITTYDGLDPAPVEAGSYAVVATIDDVNYQGSATGTLTITSTTTGVSAKVLTDIKLYPNPCRDFVYIDAIISKVNTIQIINIEGITVMQKNNCLQQEQIDISSLAKGAYMVVVDAESGRGSYRLIVQ